MRPYCKFCDAYRSKESESLNCYYCGRPLPEEVPPTIREAAEEEVPPTLREGSGKSDSNDSDSVHGVPIMMVPGLSNCSAEQSKEECSSDSCEECPETPNLDMD